MACCNNFCNCSGRRNCPCCFSPCNSEEETFICSVPQCNGEERNFICTCHDNRCFTPMGGWGIFGRRWPLGGVSFTGNVCCTCRPCDDEEAFTPCTGQ